MNHAADVPPHQPQPRNRRFSPALAVGLAAALALVAWWQWPKHTTKAVAPAVPVNAGYAVLADFPIRVVSVGTVQARNAVDVKVRVDGQLQRVLFTEGQDVKAGQVLAQLDQAPLTAQLQQAVATQQKDQATLENAKLDFARYSKLVGIGAATTQSVDTARAQVNALTATVAADAALVQNDQLQLGFTTLTAPFTGRVGAREADLGAIVHVTDTTGIVTLTQMEPIDVLFSVPQDVLPEVLANQAKSPLPVAVTTRTGSDALAQGVLTFIDSQVDPATGQVKLKGAFANVDRKLWPGELVTARVLLRTDKARVAVPSRAIVNTQAGTQVYVIGADGKAQLRPVRTGAAVDGLTEIDSGVAVGDLVVFDGQSRLNPGVSVAAKTVAARAAAASAPAASLDAPA
jgi:membrane fusion protein, multidrug efflux system